MKPLLALGLAFAAVLAAAAPARAWDIFTFPDAKFAAQFPSEPQMAQSKYRTTTGLEAPAQRWAIQERNVAYSVTLVDFSGTAFDKDTAIADAVKAFGKDGEVLVDVEARINAEWGRELSVNRKDGGHDIVAVFYFDNHLYLLNGRAAPPDPGAATANLIRFQQSLNFMR